MCRRLIYVIFLVVALSLTGSVQAQDTIDYVETTDQLWSTPGNWSTGFVPTASDWVQISNASDAHQFVIINSGFDAVSYNTYLGYTAGGTLTVEAGGTLTVENIMAVPITAGSLSEVNLDGGTITINNKLRLDLGGGTLNMTGGTLNITNNLDMDDVGGGTVNMYGGTINCNNLEMDGVGGTVNMYGGTININVDLDMDDYRDTGTRWLNMYGGTIIIGDDLEMGTDGGIVNMYDGTMIIKSSFKMNIVNQGGTFNLIGGTVTVEDDLLMQGGLIDISSGTLTLPGDVVSTVEGFIANGWITAYGGSGRVMVDYDITNPGQTTLTAIALPSCIFPENGGTYRSPADVDLIWTNIEPNSPAEPVFVDVWFGTDPNKLWPAAYSKKVTAGENVEIWTEAGLTAGTYYWQVDSYLNGADHINDSNMIEGLVWSFTLVDDTAPSVVIDTPDMVTWSGRSVQLDATVVDDGMSPVTYLWTAFPDTGVVFSATDVEDPTVTITSPTFSTVTITLAVSDEANPIPVEKSIEIDVYETECDAARIGFSLAEENPQDFNGDCLTNLEDLAEVAKAWLVDYAITEPTARP
ncbi:MAG: hypothetical protein JRG77_07615 [Deltaproteobacteria bacterium]|nr:hypothetical protein [Deltaproteobacteria bacterium]